MIINIRKERPDEYKKVENVVREAFWNIYRPGCFEHLILHNFRNNSNYVSELSNIITLDDEIIGQILFSKAQLENLSNNEKFEIGTFGPVSILPEYQKNGFGDQLINYTLENAKNLGYKYIVIFGNPNYYKKFGFASAINYGIYIEGQEENQEIDFVLIKDLNGDNQISKKTGPWYYKDPEGYEIDEKELIEFEKNFPEKKKRLK